MPNLVGIGNSQVPTNAMLGGLAYQDSVGEINIDKIKATTSDTAVDIFVYDTCKDSDGGAWRKRATTQSWYNEGVSLRRGARKEFPAVAVIVCLSNHIKIYDGDDPNLSLWMDVIGTTDRRDHGWMYGSGLNAVTALNGIIAIAANWNIGDEGGLLIMDFVKDELRRHEGTAGRSGGQLSISQRGTSANINTTQDIPLIVNSYVRDIAMTVLPNAPIDASTGLPTPTIAVATNGGFSIIKDDGTVIDKGVSSTVTNEVDWYKGQYLLGTGPEYWALYRDFLIEESGGYISSTADLYSAGNNTTWDKPQPTGKETKVVAVGDLIAGGSATAYTGHVPGLSLKVPPPDLKNGNSSLLCEIRKDYNTGWMHGDIQGAFLSDTDDTDVTGSELVTNGTFASNNVTGWTERESGGSFTASGGQATLTYSSGVASWMQDIAITAGKAYHLSFQVVSTTTSSIQFYYNHGSGDLGVSMTGSAGIFNVTFVAASNSVKIFPRIFASGSMVLDNISLRIAEEDRSVINTGLAVHGTITKSPVATGAELVAYSGFSASNYLQQPRNSNLNFGTGDFSIIFWVKYATGNNNQSFIDISSSTGGVGDPRCRIHQFHTPAGSIRFYTTDGNVVSASNKIDAGWTCVVALRRDNDLEIYINGELEGSGNTSTTNFTSSAGQLSIGMDGDTSDPLDNGSMALVRISKTAPSPEQIKKIYDDEKCLFHENAKCTLYGTAANAVTALAYDDTTNILHVGTSSGRSEFQGIKRINNTTTAVTTAISASNEFVAEQ